MNKNKLLVVVDYQNDFVTGALKNNEAIKLETGIDELVQNTLNDGGFVIFTKDTHEGDYLQSREGKHLPIPHCIENTNGHNLFGCLQKYENTQNNNILIVNKPTFGCANLPQYVLNLCKVQPDEISICGVVTDICVISNAIILHSAFTNATIKIHQNLCAATTIQGHNNAVSVLSGMGYNIVD